MLFKFIVNIFVIIARDGSFKFKVKEKKCFFECLINWDEVILI